MDVTTLRKQLHEYIDGADEQHLAAIFQLIEEDNVTYNEGAIKLFHERRDKHLKGEGKSYSAEESLSRMKEHKKGNGV